MIELDTASDVAVRPPRGSRLRDGESGWRRWQAALDRVNAVAVLLVLSDALALLGSIGITAQGRRSGCAAAAVLLGIRACAGLYRKRLWLSWLQDLPRSAGATMIGWGLLTGVLLLTSGDTEAAATTGSLVLVFAVTGELFRFTALTLGRWARRRLGRCDRCVVVGAGEIGVALARTMLAHPEYGLRPVGFVDVDPDLDRDRLPLDLLNGDLPGLLTRLRVGTVVLAFSSVHDFPSADIAAVVHRRGRTTLVVPRLFELCQDDSKHERLRSYPLVRLNIAPTSRPTWWLKRVSDLVLAAAALAALAPVIATCALGVLLESGRPVFFRQLRVGMDGRTFVLFKLRSVRTGREDDSQTRWSVAGDPRVGPVGAFLRRTSLDELPQLWNVLRGDMSIVGPRPERPGFVREFSATHDLYWARHRVPAGLTGLAQAHGLRGDTSIAERARYDNYYIANWSLWLDVKIMLLTARELFRGARPRATGGSDAAPPRS
ncbi:sugar transferase [Amycolatopsis anabasis]|uniref:sugar transferase n=1 Tax=Amycolatopsis anabasis TaxID=1840409 RepID=UPI00131BA101|nr:sugar transferase [Amycolatopsis anabasis]